MGGDAPLQLHRAQVLRLRGDGIQYLSESQSMAEWITTKEAAELSGYHMKHIRRLILAGKVKGRKVSIVWLVDRASLLSYVRKAEKLGAKRGPKQGD